MEIENHANAENIQSKNPEPIDHKNSPIRRIVAAIAAAVFTIVTQNACFYRLLGSGLETTYEWKETYSKITTTEEEPPSINIAIEDKKLNITVIGGKQPQQTEYVKRKQIKKDALGLGGVTLYFLTESLIGGGLIAGGWTLRDKMDSKYAQGSGIGLYAIGGIVLAYTIPTGILTIAEYPRIEETGRTDTKIIKQEVLPRESHIVLIKSGDRDVQLGNTNANGNFQARVALDEILSCSELASFLEKPIRVEVSLDNPVSVALDKQKLGSSLGRHHNSPEEAKAYQEYNETDTGDRIHSIGDRKAIKGLQFITDYPDSCVTEQVRKETAKNIETYWDAMVIPTNPDILKDCEREGFYRSGDLLLANHIEERISDEYNDSLNRIWFAVTLDGKCSVADQYEYYFYYKGKPEGPIKKREPSFAIVEQLPKKRFPQKFNSFRAIEDWILKPAIKFFIEGCIARKNQLGGWGPFIMEVLSNALADRSGSSSSSDKEEKQKKQSRKQQEKDECEKACKINWRDTCARGLHMILPLPQMTRTECEKNYDICMGRCEDKF